jgi:hypothetical protein
VLGNSVRAGPRSTLGDRQRLAQDSFEEAAALHLRSAQLRFELVTHRHQRVNGCDNAKLLGESDSVRTGLRCASQGPFPMPEVGSTFALTFPESSAI